MKKIDCKLAEFGLGVDNQGNLRPCCQYIKSQKKYNYKEIRDFEVNFRQKVLLNDLDQGIQHSSCQLCWRAEENGKQSLRKISNELYKDIIISNRNANKVANPIIIDFDISLGNLCNLKCIMCGPYASTQWYNEIKKHELEFKFHSFDSLGNMLIENWWEEPQLVEFIQINSQEAKKINFSGGEPFMFPRLGEVLESISNNKSLDLCLQFNTNGTVINDKILELLSRFPEVRIIVSLEGIDRHNDYIRFPSNWNSIDKNIKKFQKYKNLEVTIHHTFQPSSVYSLPPLAKYCEDNNLNLSINFLYHVFFNLNAINKNEKRSLIKWAQDQNNDLTNNAKQEVLALLSNVEPSENERNRYQEYVEFLDKIRNTNYQNVFGKF